MNYLNRLSIGQRMFILVGGGTLTVLGLMALCIHCANAMFDAALQAGISPPASMSETRARLVKISIAVGVGGLLLILPTFILVTRSIIARLIDAQKVLESVAKGDLTNPIVVSGRNEVAMLPKGIDNMQSSLTDIISQVRDSSQAMHLAVNEIASGNQDLSQRTEAQAMSLQQTKSSLDEMSLLLSENVNSTTEADALAVKSFQLAQQGSVSVLQLVERIQAISEQSRRIQDIIGVIEGIAFQTNILALNAAVESARAGEHGKGFSVVAAEVRMLAQSCGEAAKEIKSRIEISTDQVASGVDAADDAGRSMTDLVRSASETTRLINQVTHSTSAQLNAISHLQHEVSRMDSVTQQNAALVEEAAAAAESVRNQSQGLVQSVKAFQIDAAVSR